MAVEWKKIAYHIDELLVAEQEVVGRLTGGSLDGIALGIADNNVVQIDDTGPAASGEYARFTANGIEGRPAADVMGDLSGQAAAPFSMNSQKITALLDPTAAQEAATKKYVDDLINYHPPSITIENPGADNALIWFFTFVDITISEIQATIVGGTSVTFQIWHDTVQADALDGSSGQEVLDAAEVITVGETFAVGVMDAYLNIAADSYFVLYITAVSGVVTQFHVSMIYTKD